MSRWSVNPDLIWLRGKKLQSSGGGYEKRVYSGKVWNHIKARGRRIRRTVWNIPTQGHSQGHFAAFPEKLVEIPLKATCPANPPGIVLDLLIGIGTTGLVALKNGHKFIGIELNQSYIEMVNKRLEPYMSQSLTAEGLHSYLSYISKRAL